MVRDLHVLFNRLAALVLLLAVVYAVLLLPGVRSEPGYVALIDGWLNGVIRFGAIVVLLLRAFLDRKQRAAWLFLAAGLGVSLAASIAYFAHYQFVEPAPTFTWADVGWLVFYPLLYVGMVLLLRERVPRLHRSCGSTVLSRD